MTYRILHGDCLERLREMPAESVHAVVTDPPAGISFMGRTWDHDRGGRRQWIAWMTEVMAECERVLMPGGHAVVWALPRTSHWTATAIEDAGFVVRDVITHLFASGFPKSLDVSKAIDHMAGAEREVIGENGYASRRPHKEYNHQQDWGSTLGVADSALVTAPATDAARQWEGWGTALKPASEHWILARKPLRAATVASQVLETGTGALNIAGTRVATTDDRSSPPGKGSAENWRLVNRTEPSDSHIAGRFPPHLLLSCHPDCRKRGTRRVRGSHDTTGIWRGKSNGWGGGLDSQEPHAGYADPDGTELVEDIEHVEGCAVAALDAQSGDLHSAGFRQAGGEQRNGDSSIFGIGNATSAQVRYGDSGGASRFFPRLDWEPGEYEAAFKFCPKPSAAEKEAGLFGVIPCLKCGGLATTRHKDEAGRWQECRRNGHETVKPVALMQWLCRLVCPPGGVVLDPFCGSGTTGEGALREGFSFIGIDQDGRHVAVSRARIAGDNPMFNVEVG